MSKRGARRRGRDVDGILVLDKPLDLSSNQALQKAKRLFFARKAGHTGSLDVQASGVLPVCFGEATKVCQFLLDADKLYRAEITFGRSTTTADAEGEVISEHSTAGLSAAAIATAMAAFVGPGEQLPPMYSALKRHGRPLYKLAREGIEVERERRHIRIDQFTLLNYSEPRAEVEVRCSKGTYVRTLAEDLGAALGCGAHISALRRTAAGPYSIDDAVDLRAIAARLEEGGEAALDGLLQPIDSALAHLALMRLDQTALRRFESGQAVTATVAGAGQLLRVYDDHERFIGVGAISDGGQLVPRRLLRTQVSESQENSMHGSV